MNIQEKLKESRNKTIKEDSLLFFNNLDSAEERDNFISKLEEGNIVTSKEIFNNEELANQILEELIVKDYSSGTDWIKEVNESIKMYADDYLYDSVVLWCKAIDYDREMCQPIIRGYGRFFQDFERLGFPHLCLLIKASKK